MENIIDPPSIEKINENVAAFTALFGTADDLTPIFDEEEPEIAGATEVFSVDNEDRANWVLRKLSHLDAEEQRLTAQFQAMKRSIENERRFWNDRFGAQLEEFARQELIRRGGKKKSLPLLQGTLAFRSVPARFTVVDELAAMKVCEDVFPDALLTVTKVVLDKTALLGYVEKTGDLVEGVVHVPARESFSIRFGKADQ